MTTPTPRRLIVTICYAEKPSGLTTRQVQLPSGTTIQRAIHASGILALRPTINLNKNKVGIYGKIYPLSHPLCHNDRIEIYRPALAKGKNRTLINQKKNAPNPC